MLDAPSSILHIIHNTDLKKNKNTFPLPSFAAPCISWSISRRHSLSVMVNTCPFLLTYYMFQAGSNTRAKSQEEITRCQLHFSFSYFYCVAWIYFWVSKTTFYNQENQWNVLYETFEFSYSEITTEILTLSIRSVLSVFWKFSSFYVLQAWEHHYQPHYCSL